MSEIGKLKLALFKDKMDSIVKVCRGEQPYDDTYPISVELSLTNACNLRCVWCVDATVRGKYGGHIETQILYDLFDDLAEGGTKGITVEGGGEPTLHPDFAAIVRRIRERGMAVGLFSNGVTIENVLPNLDQFEWIRISLDADTPETFRAMKGEDAFERVMQNIATLAAAKNGTLVGVGYVATKQNLGSIEVLIERLRDMGVSYFYIRPVEDNPELTTRNDMAWLKSYTTEDFEVIVNYAGRISGGNSALPCVCHSLVTVISADAAVYGCGRLHIYPDHRPLGSLKEQSFREIWHGPARREMTKRLLDKRFTQQYCPVCRMTKYNEFLHEIVNTKTVNFI